MQQNGKMRTFGAADSIKKRIKVLVPALAWVCGLLLAGSDGPWMPYINGVGGLMFFGAALWLGRVLPGIEKKPRAAKAFPRSRKNCPHVKTDPQRVQPGYGGKLGLV